MSENSPRNLNSHSKAYFEALEVYGQKLQKQGLPVIYSLKHLSLLLGVEHKILKTLIERRSNYYKAFYLRKKNGGKRLIQTPIEILKYIQKSIVENILINIEPDKACLGFRKGYSIKHNADLHQSQEMVLRVDLFRFFDTITERRVYGFFKNLGYAPNLAYDLAKLTTLSLSEAYLIEIMNEDRSSSFPINQDPRLPQGAPSSPILSNLIARKMDKRFRHLALKYNFTYSRYADDLIFSGRECNIPSMELIKTIIKDEGFIINEQKIHFAPRGDRQLVTGLTVTDGVHVPKKFKQETKRHLYFCNKFGVRNHLKKIGSDKSAFREWLLGRIYFINSIEPEEAQKLLAEFHKINWQEYSPLT
ncbi:reverse transcriptase family protein [Paenibacillus illinoisensis]|uniref:reverse transcriptase family protein n=1 Tax=Paenibacillus illinoisensis TaxID=59845 RepID=UPI00301AFEDC